MGKVSVIGAGNVGATTVYYIAEKSLADIVMVDVVAGLPQSKGLDFLHSAPLRQYNVRIFGTNSIEEIAGSDVVVFTAGVARKPGMDRMDLLKINAKIAQEAAMAIAKYAPDAVVVVVTNPLDVICMVVLKETSFDSRKYGRVMLLLWFLEGMETVWCL
jgi:malate dehydrogenase